MKNKTKIIFNFIFYDFHMLIWKVNVNNARIVVNIVTVRTAVRLLQSISCVSLELTSIVVPSLLVLN